MTNHLYEAQELKDRYPKLTNGFSVFEVERLWEDYSETYATGWIEPNEFSVREVFNFFKNE